MRNKVFVFCFTLFICILLLATSSSAEVAAYKIIIEDDANLLTAQETESLRTYMNTLTEFGNVIFKTTNKSIGSKSSLKYIQDYYYSILKNEKGVAFYIDMNNRQVCACATGGLNQIITNSMCDTIMDNVYTYAKRQKYYDCAKETFIQMNTLLNGGKIAESMKYICNSFVAVMLSLFLTYGLFILISRSKKTSKKELIDECNISLDSSPITVTKTGQRSVYSPPSSSSGGSFGGGGGGRWWRRRFLWKWWKPWILILYCSTSNATPAKCCDCANQLIQ